MGRLTFYVLWSLCDAPRQFIRKPTRRCFHVHVPLPLPRQLVIFSLGDWSSTEASIAVEVLVSADVQAQRIGILSSQARCLIFEGGWNSNLESLAAERGRRGVYGKIVLTLCGEHEASIFSSTPLAQRKRPFPEQLNTTDLSCTSHHCAGDKMVSPNSSHLGSSVCDTETRVNNIDSSELVTLNGPLLWPTDETPRKTAISKSGQLKLGAWSSEEMDSLSEARDQASTLKKARLPRLNSQDQITMQIKSENREVCPSKRWGQAMCLSDSYTCVLIGGETTDQSYSKDSLWKLELDNNFWYPMDSSPSGPVPPCSRGHSATYDSDSKAVFVYGGLREGQRYDELFILDTLTWKWKLVTAKGNIPRLAYHAAAFYKKELFVFGGIEPGHSSGEKPCSNALYIFNPEFELWYKPIVEGDKPLPRFGHSATLLSQNLFIFGGRKTATYLNDLHALDLGFMEYTAVKCGNMPPLPRGFHAALPVSDNRILISGGCSSIGALQDAFVYNTDTTLWTSVTSSLLCSKPRAGHSVISLDMTPSAARQHKQNERTICTLLVFGGSDCFGSFYNDTFKCTVEISTPK